ncbi:hypothetical protein ACJX0J_010043, partial [Zea mays]
VTWLTLTDGSTVMSDGHAPSRGRKGLTFRVLVHLDIIEPPPDEYGNVIPRKMDSRFGVIDGEHSTRDRRDPHHPDKGGWRSRVFQSLSRAPISGRECDRSALRHGLQEDNSSSAGRHRCPAAAPPPHRVVLNGRRNTSTGRHHFPSLFRLLVRGWAANGSSGCADSEGAGRGGIWLPYCFICECRPTHGGRFKLGIFYRRRARKQVAMAAPAPTTPGRFKPGRVFRRRPRGPGGTTAHRGCSRSAASTSLSGDKTEAFLASISRQ